MNLTETLEQQVINIRLEEVFGKHPATNQARWRVAFSDDRTEVRYGEFEDWHHGIFIRRVSETREVKKYPWLNGQWMIERLMPNHFPDVIEGDYIYECAWALPEGRQLFWEPIRDFVSYIMSGKMKSGPKTQKECDDLEREHLERERIATRDMIDTTVLETSLNDGSAEFYDGRTEYRPSKLVSDVGANDNAKSDDS